MHVQRLSSSWELYYVLHCFLLLDIINNNLQESCIRSLMIPSDQMTTMTGFTADFFGALQTTFTDNSLNNSKLSQSNANRSQFMQEIRQESGAKIAQFATKMLKALVFQRIWLTAQRKRRNEQKNPLNLHKCMYKIDLLFKMKNRAKLQWSYHRLTKFAQEFDMKNLNPVQKLQLLKSKQIGEFTKVLLLLVKKIHHVDLERAFIKIKSRPPKAPRKPVRQNVNLEHVAKLTIVIFRVLSQKRILRLSMQAIRNYENYLDCKQYFIRSIFFMGTKVLRSAFVLIANTLKSTKNQTNQSALIVKQTQKIQRQSEKRLYSQKYKNKNSEQLELPINKQLNENNSSTYFQENKTVAQVESRKPESRLSTEPDQTRNRPSSGLKFNRCFKKKSDIMERKQEPQQRLQNPSRIGSPLLKKKSTITISQSRLIRINMFPKAIRCSKQIHDCAFSRAPTKWKDFTSFQKIYYLSPQDLKREVPEIQDQTLQGSDNMSSSRSSSQGDKLEFNSRRMHKLENKKPLQFSGKRHKSKISSNKSKRSTGKSEDEEPETVNMQSLKSYYFPENQKYGKTETNTEPKHPSSTKFIGSVKWNGQQKKRVATQHNLINARSAQKINPYLQQLKQKIARKPVERVISLHKMIERSNSARSNSKNSKTSKDSQKKGQKRKQQIQHQQVTVSTSESKSRNISPMPKMRIESTKTPSPAVPREWCLYNNYNQGAAVPIRNSEVKPSLQFQRVIKTNTVFGVGNMSGARNSNGEYRNNFQ